MSSTPKPILLVHGGAWAIPEHEHQAHLAGMRAGLGVGWNALSKGASALDAVEESLAVMEDDPTFDAGRGSCLNTDGSVEMDASIMDGRDRSAGGVAVLRNFQHPIRIARRVMERTEHVLLAGEGASAFARAEGFEPVDSMELLTVREQERLARLQADPAFRTPYAFGEERSVPDEPELAGTPSGTRPLPAKGGTVGAVAIDCQGDVAAGTSTGGTPKKIPGRVGDSCQIGCGTFADNRYGAVSVTGWGESIIKAGTARTVIERLRAGDLPEEAAAVALQDLSELVRGLGGVIVVDHLGRYAACFNTPCMARGWWLSGMQAPWVGI